MKRNADRTNPTAQTYTTEAGSYLPLSLPYPLDYQGNTYRIDGSAGRKNGGKFNHSSRWDGRTVWNGNAGYEC
ncbi:MAG: hypothetical protein ACLR8P_07120 [Clostridium fessum]